MKTILWKELRQNARYAPIGLVLLSFAVWETLRSSQLVFDANNRLPGYVLIIGGVFSLALGFFQFRSDRDPAARALLLHRCTGISTVFWGKFFAGVLMYLAAMLPPLVFLVIRFMVDDRQTMATYPSAVLPSLFTLVAAFLFWPVSCLLIHRRSRFLGGRLLPLVACLIAMAGLNIALSQTDNLLTWSILGILPLVALTYLARLAFEEKQELTPQARVSLWLINTFALLTAFIGVSGSLYDTSYIGERYHITFGEDARPWLVEQSIRSGPAELRATPMSADHSVKDSGDFRTEIPAIEFVQLQTTSPLRHHRHMMLLQSYREPDSAAAQIETVLDDRAGEILVYRNDGFGYQLQRRLRPDSGPMGRYVSHQSSIAHIPMQYHAHGWTPALAAPALLACDNGVYLIGPRAEAVRTLIQYSPNEPAGRVSVVNHNHRSDAVEYGIRIADDAVFIRGEIPPDATLPQSSAIDSDAAPLAPARSTAAVGGVATPLTTPPAVQQSIAEIDLDSIGIRKVPLPSEVRSYDNVFLAKIPGTDDQFSCFAHQPSGRLTLVDVPAVRFDASGQTIEQVVYHEYVGMEGSGKSGWSIAAFVPSGVFALIAGLDTMLSENPTVASSSLAEFRKDPAHVMWLLVIAGLGFAAAVWVTRRRRLSGMAALGCCLAGTLFGPLSALAVLTVYPAVNRQPCFACGRPTPVSLATCEHCQTDSSELPKRGIEIIESRSKPASALPLSASAPG